MSFLLLLLDFVEYVTARFFFGLLIGHVSIFAKLVCYKTTSKIARCLVEIENDLLKRSEKFFRG